LFSSRAYTRAPQLDRRAASVSKTLGSVLASGGEFTENEQGEFSFPMIPTHILELVVRFMLCVASGSAWLAGFC